MTRRTAPPRKSLGDHILHDIWKQNIHAIQKIDSRHVFQHSGLGHTYTDYWGDIDDPSGAKVVIYATGEGDRDYHLTVRSVLSAAGRLQIWENVTLTSTGVAVSSYNMNRNKANSTLVTVYSGVSVYDITASGTKIFDEYIGSTKFHSGPPGEEELVLIPNKYYLSWIKPAADNAIGSIKIQWYEVPS